MGNIVDGRQLGHGFHDAQPLYECSGCKSWLPASACALHAKKCRRLLLIKDVHKARKGSAR